MRASIEPRGNLADQIDILIAFDTEAVQKASPMLAPYSVVIFDSSREAMPPGLVPGTALVIPVPFSRLAVRDLRRDLFKNSLGFGLMGRIIGLADEEVENCLRNHFKKLSRPTVGTEHQGASRRTGLCRQRRYQRQATPS